MGNMMLAAGTLWRREIVRFYRDRSRVIGGLVPPIIFWFLIGSGLSSSFRVGGSEGITYLQYFFPGTLVLIFLFTAVFSTISIIEDRREGFLQSVLVAPVPRISIVLGKLMGSASLAFFQGIPFLLLAPLAGVHFQPGSLIATVFILFGVAFSLAGIGFLIAWTLDSMQGFHAIMNMFLIPMWLLSGALFPTGGAPVWLERAVQVNPLTYCVAALQHILLPPALSSNLPPLELCVVVIALFCAFTFAAAIMVTKKKRDK